MEQQTLRGHKGNAKKYGPLLSAELLRPYLVKFEDDHPDDRIDHLLGETLSRALRRVVNREQKFIGLYKADALLCAIGVGALAWRVDEKLRRAFETPEGEVFAR